MGNVAEAVAAGGTLGILIPPSTGFVLYTIMTEESIGKLSIAGILPRILPETVTLTAMLLLIVIGAHVFGPFLALTHIPETLAHELRAFWPAISTQHGIGIGQAAYHLAAVAGGRFSVVTTLEVSVGIEQRTPQSLGISVFDGVRAAALFASQI